MQTKPNSVNEYIGSFTGIQNEKLQELRSILQSLCPNAKEVLKWGKPVFESKSILFA